MSKRKSYDYPPPLIVSPTSGIHKTTLIILHGRGSTGDKFAEPLLPQLVTPPTTSPPSTSQTFQSHFPTTKFIFPTASLRRAAAYNRSLVHQWFDMYPLDQYPPEHKEHIQYAGLRESVAYVHGLLKDAVEEVGAENVALVGLSQGCAVGLVSVMLWEGDRLGGFVGMCGWLPLRKSMIEASKEEENDLKEDDVFETGDGNEEKSKPEQVTDWLREEIEFPVPKSSVGEERKASASKETPVFLGHGKEDQKVPCDLGKLAAEFLKDLEIDVAYSEYEGLGHWYSEYMFGDVVEFLGRWKVGSVE